MMQDMSSEVTLTILVLLGLLVGSSSFALMVFFVVFK